MNKNVISIYPSNRFKVVAENAVKEIVCGLILGYDIDGELIVYGGGILDGKQPLLKDFLWMVDTFKYNLISGEYSKQEE